MNVALFGLGAAVLTITSIDILWTTLWVEGGAGPITKRLMARIWRVIKRLGDGSPHLRTLSGPSILITSLTTWVSLLWGGWTLVFASADAALIDTQQRGTTSIVELLYFTGYTVFTLGIGDYVPRGAIWQLATILATASGLLFVTLAVTYLLSVLGAVTQKRAFASAVSGLGSDGPDIVRTSWNGTSFVGLDVPVHALSSELATLTSNHKAYPILHYFHTRHPEQAPAHRIPVFDTALTLLRFGVPAEHRPNEVMLRTARTSVDNYLGTLHDAFVYPSDRVPPSPELAPLREAGIPTVTDDEFAAKLSALDERRRLLLGLARSDVRQWPSRAE